MILLPPPREPWSYPARPTLQGGKQASLAPVNLRAIMKCLLFSDPCLQMKVESISCLLPRPLLPPCKWQTAEIVLEWQRASRVFSPLQGKKKKKNFKIKRGHLLPEECVTIKRTSSNWACRPYFLFNVSNRNLFLTFPEAKRLRSEC